MKNLHKKTTKKILHQEEPKSNKNGESVFLGIDNFILPFIALYSPFNRTIKMKDFFSGI